MTLPRVSSEVHKSCWVLQLLQRSQEVDAYGTYIRRLGQGGGGGGMCLGLFGFFKVQLQVEKVEKWKLFFHLLLEK